MFRHEVGDGKEGKLLLTAGELDDNVDPVDTPGCARPNEGEQSFRFADDARRQAHARR